MYSTHLALFQGCVLYTLGNFLRAQAFREEKYSELTICVDYDVIQMAIGHLSDDMTDTYIIPEPQKLTDALNNLYKLVPPLS